MNGAFYIGATGLNAQERALGVIAHNITNLNTPAFKRSEVSFAELVATQDLLYDDPILFADRTIAMSGVAVDATARIFEQGELRITNNALDLAIDGEGFIELVGANGEPLLWRGGSLTLNEDGYLSGADDLPLRALISVPTGATNLTIDRDGLVTATLEGDVEPIELGQIEIALVRDTARLTSAGEGLYRVAEESEVIVAAAGEEGAGRLLQGALENSNVDLTNEVVMLLLAQRGFGASAQVVQAGDRLMAIANELRG